MIEKARQLEHKFIITDGHIDIPYRLNDLMEDISMRTELGEFDFVRAKEGGLDAPFMSIYVPSSYQETGGARDFADEMIAMVGGTNVFHAAPSTYHRVSMEAVLERLPDVIIDTSDNGPLALRGRVHGDWGQWAFLPAGREQRVYLVDPSRLVIPGIRLPEMTRLMGKLIQPEAFGQASGEELVRQ